MPDENASFRLKIMIALTDLLKQITPANGYRFDLSDETIEEDSQTGTRPRVYRGKYLFGEGDPLPCVAILEHNDMLDQMVSQGNNNSYKGPLDIIIQGFVPDDPHHPTDPAYDLLAEIKRILATQKDRRIPMNQMPDYLGLGVRDVNAITGFAVGPGSVRPPGELSANAFCYLVLSLEVTEDTSRPYD